MKIYVVNAITDKSHIKILGEYADRSTAQRVCTVSKSNYDSSKRTIERCCYFAGVPSVEFAISEIYREPTVEETAAVLRNDVEKNYKVSRTLDVWKEITEFIRDNSGKTMNSYQDYIDFYYDNTRVYSNMHDYLDSELNDSASFTAYKAKIDEFELAIKSGDKKILSNGEIIEII